jgi:ribokinase
MSRIVITGYASLDHVAVLDGVPQAGRTTTVLARPPDGWPRLGGSPVYMAAALVSMGVEGAVPVSWVGEDQAGEIYRRQLESRGLSSEGIATVPGAHTPAAVLAYQPDGGCICLYDPGTYSDLELTDAQRALVAGAEWVCVTVGPRTVIGAVLDTIEEETKLAWVAKHDPKAMPVSEAARLAGRADLLCYSQAEAAFVEWSCANAPTLRARQILIETRGRAGASFTRNGETKAVAAAPIAVSDPTGAGDSFAGGIVAALFRGVSDPAEILGWGHHAARRLLLSRQSQSMESA